MKLVHDEDKFINRMLEETYEVLGSPMRGDVAHPIESFFRQERIRYFHCQYLPESSCFRIQIELTVLDIPSNWSVFQKIYTSFCDMTDFVHHITEDNDADKIRDVIRLLAVQENDLMFVHAQGGLFLAFVNKEHSHLVARTHDFIGSMNLNSDRVGQRAA